jgi:hypothetical protein
MSSGYCCRLLTCCSDWKHVTCTESIAVFWWLLSVHWWEVLPTTPQVAQYKYILYQTILTQPLMPLLLLLLAIRPSGCSWLPPGAARSGHARRLRADRAPHPAWKAQVRWLETCAAGTLFRLWEQARVQCAAPTATCLLSALWVSLFDSRIAICCAQVCMRLAQRDVCVLPAAAAAC